MEIFLFLNNCLDEVPLTVATQRKDLSRPQFSSQLNTRKSRRDDYECSRHEDKSRKLKRHSPYRRSNDDERYRLNGSRSQTYSRDRRSQVSRSDRSPQRSKLLSSISYQVVFKIN